ncbi:MAG: PD40 domain-containing protein, partial [Ferruginibacter sp.]|nr:PD40 domain-containing protein [Cytophagales bacterium]
MKKLCLLWFVLPMGVTALAQDNPTYQTPPQAIAALIDAPATPRVSVSSDGKWMLLMEVQDLSSIADLAQPELRIAGLRLNPRTNGPSRTSYSTSMKLKRLDNGQEFAVRGLPAQPKISGVSWSPDNAKIAFAHTRDDDTSGKIELWTVDVAAATARRLTDAPLNAVFVSPYEWFPDSQTLLIRTVPEGRGEAPAANPVPTGPIVQENAGKKAAARTYQDLLKNPNDERVFDHYATSQLLKVSLAGKTDKMGQPGVIQQAVPSPDGQYLLVKTRHRPYSYQLTVGSFPNQVNVLDRDGNPVKALADLPLADNVPTSFDAVPTGPRGHAWRDDAAATLYWVEAQDGGDPRQEAPVRDKVFTLEAPFAAAPTELVALPLRYGGISWGNATLALVDGYRWADRKLTTWTLNPAAKSEPQLLFDRSSEDTYHDPGVPYLTRNAAGKNVLATDASGQFLYLIGSGASPEGDRPFVDALDLKTRKSVRWWRSEAPYYEVPIALLDLDKRRVLTRRESPQDNPNYFVRDLKNKKITQFTRFPNPYAGIGVLKKQVLQYRRAD